MSLRRIEEKRKFTFYELGSEEREKIIEAIKDVLENRSEVVLVVIYGGFLNSKVFRDVDVAIFTGYSVPYEREIEYCDKLSEELERKVGLPVDVRLLDYAPTWFRMEVLSTGRAIINKHFAFERLKIASWKELSDIKIKYSKLLGKEK